MNSIEQICSLVDLAVDVKYVPSMKNNPPPLVTPQEIRSARNICPDRISGCFILEINQSIILKVGHAVRMGEAEAMILVQNQTSVPVPQVFNAYCINEIGFILMEKIPGAPLSTHWDTLPQKVKLSITEQLCDYIKQWRQLKGLFFGTVDGGPCQDIIFKHPWENKEYEYGPYSTREEFNKGMVEALQRSRPNQKLTKKDQFFTERLLSSRSGEEQMKVFTHGDLNQSNIIIQNGVITGIVDWGTAGYSVLAREYFCLRWTAMDPEWIEPFSAVLPTNEYKFWEEVNYQMMAYTCI